MSLFFPDNTVLINFAIIGRVQLLEELANGNGRWCLSVSQECAKSARVDGLEALEDLLDLAERVRKLSAEEHARCVDLLAAAGRRRARR